MGARSENLVSHWLSQNNYCSQRTQNCTSDLETGIRFLNLRSTLTGALSSYLACVNGKAEPLHEKRKPDPLFPRSGLTAIDCMYILHLLSRATSKETSKPGGCSPFSSLCFNDGMCVCVEGGYINRLVFRAVLEN